MRYKGSIRGSLLNDYSLVRRKGRGKSKKLTITGACLDCSYVLLGACFDRHFGPGPRI